MIYKKFVVWVNKNCPDDWEQDEFIEYLASRAAMICDEGAKNKKITTKQFVSAICEGKVEAFYTH